MAPPSLVNIERIDGGAGNDTVIGTAGNSVTDLLNELGPTGAEVA